MTSAPVLILPDFSKGFELEIDTREWQIGCSLDARKVVAFLARICGPKSQALATNKKRIPCSLNCPSRMDTLLGWSTICDKNKSDQSQVPFRATIKARNVNCCRFIVKLSTRGRDYADTNLGRRDETKL